MLLFLLVRDVNTALITIFLLGLISSSRLVGPTLMLLLSTTVSNELEGDIIGHTWTESVETGLRFNGISDTRIAAMLRRNTLTSAAVRPVAARDAARVPVRPITELNDRCAFTDWSLWVTCSVECSAKTNH